MARGDETPARWSASPASGSGSSRRFVDLGSADYSRARTYHSNRVKDVWTPFVEPSFLSEFVLSADAAPSD